MINQLLPHAAKRRSASCKQTKSRGYPPTTTAGLHSATCWTINVRYRYEVFRAAGKQRRELICRFQFPQEVGTILAFFLSPFSFEADLARHFVSL